MRIITIKIGSSILLTQRNKLDEFRIAHIADQVISLKERDIGVILVVSGAVACGSQWIYCSSDKQELKKLAAGVGQAYLISVIHYIFSKKQLQIAQVLLTKNALDSIGKKNKVTKLLLEYVRLGVIPVINENDVIDLNSFGGNDLLATDIALLLQETQLLILSTMAVSAYGVGGGTTKQKALKILKAQHILATIVDGKSQNIILQNVL